MKSILSSLIFATTLLLAPTKALSNAPYDFLTKFSLDSIRMNGSIAHIVLAHQETLSPPRFELIARGHCLESFPPICHATLVRLDDQFGGEEASASSIKVDLKDLFPYGSPTKVRIQAPEKTVQVLF